MFVIHSLNDTVLSPSCTVRCTGVIESLVFLSVYIYIYALAHTYKKVYS